MLDVPSESSFVPEARSPFTDPPGKERFLCSPLKFFCWMGHFSLERLFFAPFQVWHLPPGPQQIFFVLSHGLGRPFPSFITRAIFTFLNHPPLGFFPPLSTEKNFALSACLCVAKLELVFFFLDLFH